MGACTCALSLSQINTQIFFKKELGYDLEYGKYALNHSKLLGKEKYALPQNH